MAAARPPLGTPRVTGLIDLAARRLGGMVLAANDEFFAAKDNLLDPRPPHFDPDRYDDRGKVMDGWETRRRRDVRSDDVHDWCVVRLGVPGIVEGVVVDTTHFRGNYPAACALEGCVSDGSPPDDTTDWFPLLDRTELRGDAVQRFEVSEPWRVTHVRLAIYPDGGVARLRVLGRGLVDLHRAADANGRCDLAAAINGGRAVGCSDEFFSSPHNLVMVGDARDMADGWETRRRRGPGHDVALLELATTGVVERLEIDTTHFKGNFPDRVAVDAAHAPDRDVDDLPEDAWVPLLEPTPVQPHWRHVFEVRAAVPASHLRLRVLPDGGVARLRAFGPITDDGWRRAGLRVLHAATPTAAEVALLACCGSRRFARELAARRPFTDPDDLQGAAAEVWASLDDDDVREAIAAHPRIGERDATARWSAGEQAGAATADAATLEALAEANRAYEERFGHVFLIRASGRTAAEMLDAVRERLTNDPVTELRVAADQQREITALRLDRLLREGGA
ncbi:allantoicase [Nitriliruptoraceae bacterium ZYF776]|nr:allantoicase [Profundirhabdus halotolerans]